MTAITGRTTNFVTSLATSPDAVNNNRFRRQRFGMFLKLVDGVIAAKGSCSILDVGGRVAHWQAHANLWHDKPLAVTLVNLEAETVAQPFSSVVGDARTLEGFVDDSFDVVYSNSVIEHVGMWSDQKRMAAAIGRVAPRHFVQTPNYWFPIEPHFRTPFIHWLPEPWRVAMVMRKARGFYVKAGDVSQARETLQDAALLDAPAMRALFPRSTILREKVALLTKSLIAVKDTI